MVQDGVVDGCHACDLLLQGLLLLQLKLLSLTEGLVLVDSTTLLWDLALLVDVLAEDILFVELACPSLWDPVLDLILDSLLVWTLGQGCGQRLVMQLIELIVELRNHVLDVLTLLIRVQLLQHSTLNGLLLEVGLLDPRVEWLLGEQISHLCILIL